MSLKRKSTKPKNKLNASKAEYNGIKFDSTKERDRYIQLLQMQKKGEINDLELQKQYVLIPAQYAKSTEVYSRGKNKGQEKRGELLERAVSYIADFVYTKDGTTVVEDVKGYRDPASATYKVFVLKRKMMLYFYGINVSEV